MNYYKIVKNVKGILYSANYSGMKEYGLTNYCVTYDVGQKTVPKIKHTKLFCFTDLQTAHDFKSMLKPDIDGVLEIYECEVENPSSKNVGRYLYMLDGIKNWFQKKKYTLFRFEKYNIPNNTVTCDSIVLTKKVG